MDVFFLAVVPTGTSNPTPNPCIMVLMTLDVKPEVAAALEALATAKGLSVEDYLERLVQKELPPQLEGSAGSEGSGMVWEGGLLVYRTGEALPTSIIDDVVRQVREERAQHILGKRP